MKRKTNTLVYCAIMLTLLIAGAYIRVPIPYVPFTLQFLMVTLCGQLLGHRYGGLVVIVYILMGIIGFPVFTSGGGIAYIFQPTFGYILGFLLAAVTIGYIVEKFHFRYIRIVANLIGILCMYLCGVTYLYFLYKYYIGNDLGLIYILEIGVLVQLPGDLILAFVGAHVAKRLCVLISFR